MLEINKQIVRSILSEETPQLKLSEKLKKTLSTEHQWLLTHIKKKKRIYGVNTGFGKNIETFLNTKQTQKLQENLSAYLDCAQGNPLDFTTSRLTFLARLKHITSGNTGVSLETVEFLINLFNKNIAPMIYPEGSLGASGDLVTMAPLARLLIDPMTECWFQGKKTSLKELNIEIPGKMGPRDALCLMNGLSNAAAMLCVEVEKTRDLLNLAMSSLLISKLSLSSDFSTEHPHLHLAPVRKFIGQEKISHFFYSEGQKNSKKNIADVPLQDQYSFRCIPQIIAPLWEMFQQVENWAYQEINSQSDNPRIEENEIRNGGNFYGGYLAFGSDHLAHIQIKTAELLDRQSFILVSGHRNLPVNLIKQDNDSYFHGLKGIHQVSNSFFMNILQYQHNFALNTRSCESHNQDMVSNCANGILRLEKVRKNFSQIIAAHLCLSCQALDLVEDHKLSGLVKEVYRSVRSKVSFVEKDRPLGKELKDLVYLIQNKKICDGVF